jgi:pimeloyl-ACP methyl ester carboxylesterase
VPFIGARGQRFYVEDSGGDGLPVIMSHGFLMDHEMFESQVRALSPEFRCITWDQRGFGQTESDSEPFTVWDAAEDCAAVLDALAIPRAVILGMSFGGWLSTRFCLAHPERATALVIVDSYEEVDPPERSDAYRSIRDRVMNEGFSPDMADLMRSRLFGPSFDATRWISKWRFRSPLTYQASYEALIGRDDIGERLSDIVCPSIVFHGELNIWFGPDVSEHLASRLGNCRGVVRVPGGHHSNIEVPEVVNPHLIDFLRSLGRRRQASLSGKAQR